jgi:hypothetical protein
MNDVGFNAPSAQPPRQPEAISPSLEGQDPSALLQLLHRWRDQAIAAGGCVTRMDRRAKTDRLDADGGYAGAGSPVPQPAAVARYAGVTGSPDESGAKRGERGLAKSGNARVRRGLMQLAWRFLRFQSESALAKWYRERTEGGKRKTTMIVGLARKLLVSLWRLATLGEVPPGVRLRTAVA